MDNKELDRWSEYFEELFNKPPPTTYHSPSTPKPTSKVDETALEIYAIAEAIKHLKNLNAPDLDNINRKMLKLDLNFLSSVLKPL